MYASSAAFIHALRHNSSLWHSIAKMLTRQQVHYSINLLICQQRARKENKKNGTVAAPWLNFLGVIAPPLSPAAKDGNFNAGMKSTGA